MPNELTIEGFKQKFPELFDTDLANMLSKAQDFSRLPTLDLDLEAIKQARKEEEFGVLRAGKPTDFQRPFVEVIKEQIGGTAKESLEQTAYGLDLLSRDPATLTPDEKKEQVNVLLGFTPFGISKKIPTFTGEASKVESMFNRATEKAHEIRKVSVSKIIKDLRRTTIDVSGNVKKELLKQGTPGKTAVMHKDLIAGASSKANQNFHDASLRIFRGLDSTEHEYLDRLIQSRRTLNIEGYKPGIKHPEGLVKEHLDWIEQLPAEMRTKLNAHADDYFREMRKILDNLHNEGLVTKQAYDDLVSKGDYSPRQFFKYIDPEITKEIGGRKISVAESGIKALKEGDYSLLEKDSSLLLANAMTRAETRIFRNRANQALYELAEQVPDNIVVKKAKVIGITGEKVIDQTPLYQSIRQLSREIQNLPSEKIEQKVIERFGKDPVITLYRGITPSRRPATFDSDITSQVGRFWTPNIAHAKLFAIESEGGEIFKIKIRASLLLKGRLNRTAELAKGEVRLGDIFQKQAEKVTKGKPVFQKAGVGEEKISVLIDGQKREMIMPTEMAREWVKNDPAINQALSTTLGWISGAKILRPMATGLNPEFALTNFPRDLAHIWITTEEYSATLPKFFFQMGSDIKAITKDAVTRKGRFLDYINEGGGMDFLTHQGRFKPKGHGAVERIQNVMGYLGETSEIMGRLALRERALKNGLSPTEATWVARNYLDFNQGGSFAKAVDSAVPYLNASIQGTRGIFRAAGNNPKVFTYKAAQIGTLAASLYYTNKYLNPEAWDMVHPREKVNNWIITTPFSYKDKQGNERHIYFKIAKDQGQRVFATLFESMMAKYDGDEVDTDQIVQSIEDAIPIMPETIIPPSLDAILGYALNKDFWRKDDIWRGPQVLPREEWNFYTHPAFIKWGDITGMSPERTRYALSQYFTSGNIYTSMAGYGWKQIFDEMSEAEKHKVTEELILNKPFIRRMVNETRPFNKQKKEIEKVRLQSNTERYIVNRQFDILTQSYLDGRSTKDEVNKFITAQKREDRKRLKQRFRDTERLDVPDRIWWRNTSRLNPEARAIVYWNRWKNAEEDEQEMLGKNLRRVPGYNTTRFRRKLNGLKREGDKIVPDISKEKTGFQMDSDVIEEPIESEDQSLMLEESIVEEPIKEVAFIDTIPIDLKITTTGIHEKTGQAFEIQENAREAFTRVEQSIDALTKTLEAMNA